MAKLRPIFLWAAALLLSWSSACSSGRAPSNRRFESLPEPKVTVFRPGELVSGETTTYRSLSRGDFFASSPPPAVADHAKQMGAVTCANVVANASPSLAIRPDPSGDGYVAKPANVSFHAEFDRSCSWWNPNETRFTEEYLLQHEQIHFGLAEISARDVDKRVQLISGRGNSRQAATTDLQRQVADLLRQAADELFAKSRRFDLDTAGYPRPENQDRWQREIEAQLAGER